MPRFGSEVIIVPALFFTVGYVAWVLATTVQRRARMKLVADFHARLLDRLGSAKDFSDFAQTDAGARFMRAFTTEPAAGGGTHERILRAAQLGAVFICLGLGLLLVGVFSPLTMADAQPVVNRVGAIALSLGIGFAVSAAVSYRLAGVLGLIRRNGEGPAGPGITGD